MSALNAKACRIETGCGTMSMSLWDDNAFYADIKKCGGCATAGAEANSRLIGLCLRHGIPIEQITKQLMGIRCSSPHINTLSCADAIAKGLEEIAQVIKPDESGG